MTDFDINKVKIQNLRRIMELHGLTVGKLAEKIGVQQPHISSCLHGTRSIGDKTIQKISDALGIDKSEFFKIETVLPESDGSTIRRIPVLTWDQAAHVATSDDAWPGMFKDIEDHIYSTRPIYSRNAFALRVKDDSMAPRYLPGDAIVIDTPPGLAEKNYPCVVLLNGEAVFIMLRETEDAVMLEPLNVKYPDIIIKKDRPIDFLVIGRVVDMIPEL